MDQVKIQNVQKNFDYVLEKVGLTSFIKWDKFSLSSSQIIKAIDEFNKKMSIFRQCQHRNFIQTMKKLKSLDLPDLITAVKNKKLPKQALRGVLTRFKIGENQRIELIEPVDNLKQYANKEFDEYISRNNSFVDELKKYELLLDERIKQSGYVPEQPARQIPKPTVNFNLSEQLASKIASEIKIELLPGTSYIGLKTYSQIIESSYQLLKPQNERLTRNARVQLRMNVKNEKKYLSLMKHHIINCELLIIEGQKLLASKLGLKKEQFQISQSLLIQRGLGEHMNMLQSKLRSTLKQSITSNNDVSYEVAKQVIAYQIKLFQQKQNFIVKVFKGLQDNQQKLQLIPLMLSLILNDFTFEKYGYEEQDFMKNINDQIISNHPDLGKLFKEMQIAIIKIMQKIGVMNEEMGKFLEEGAKETTGIYQPMPILSNPLEIIQKKQQQWAAQKGQK